ncbi:MAG: hypothetical protein MUP70_10835 [Candidatus Aminicenantes bacterium]|nr:hypothetical protein [Candidatus Aminicenantes bacterium]
MIRLWRSWLEWLTESPKPQTAFQLTSRYMSGLRVTGKDKGQNKHVVLPIQAKTLRPSFSGTNILEPARLEALLGEGKDNLPFNGHPVGVLLPEACQRTFVFSFSSLPRSSQEREQVIQHRIKKQMPMLAPNSRLAFFRMKAGEKERVFVAIANISVIKEYEGIFARCGLKVGWMGVPIVGLYNVETWPTDRNVLLANLEENSLSLLAVIGGKVVLARQKTSFSPTFGETGISDKISTILQEIENTLNFIEDQEGQTIHSLRLRLGGISEERMMRDTLADRLDCPIEDLTVANTTIRRQADRSLLAPLIGYLG